MDTFKNTPLRMLHEWVNPAKREHHQQESVPSQRLHTPNSVDRAFLVPAQSTPSPQRLAPHSPVIRRRSVPVCLQRSPGTPLFSLLSEDLLSSQWDDLRSQATEASPAVCGKSPKPRGATSLAKDSAQAMPQSAVLLDFDAASSFEKLVQDSPLTKVVRGALGEDVKKSPPGVDSPILMDDDAPVILEGSDDLSMTVIVEDLPDVRNQTMTKVKSTNGISSVGNDRYCDLRLESPRSPTDDGPYDSSDSEDPFHHLSVTQLFNTPDRRVPIPKPVYVSVPAPRRRKTQNMKNAKDKANPPSSSQNLNGSTKSMPNLNPPLQTKIQTKPKAKSSSTTPKKTEKATTEKAPKAQSSDVNSKLVEPKSSKTPNTSKAPKELKTPKTSNQEKTKPVVKKKSEAKVVKTPAPLIQDEPNVTALILENELVTPKNTHVRKSSTKSASNKWNTTVSSEKDKLVDSPNESKVSIDSGLDTSQRSSRGRVIIKPLDYWRNERVEKGKDGSSIGISKGSPDFLTASDHSRNKISKPKNSPQQSNGIKSNKKPKVGFKSSPEPNKKNVTGKDTNQKVASQAPLDWENSSESADELASTHSAMLSNTSKSKTTLSFSTTNKSEIDADGWSRMEITNLRMSVSSMNPINVHFWEDVAEMMPGRNADDCYKKYSSVYRRGNPKPEENKKSKQSSPKQPMVNEGLRIEGGVGTLKRKRALRRAMEIVDMNHNDDIFDSTPMKAVTVTPGRAHLLETSFEGFAVPASGKKSSEITPIKHLESSFDSDNPLDSELLQPVNRFATDAYINKIQQKRKVTITSKTSRKQRRTSTATPSSHRSRIPLGLSRDAQKALQQNQANSARRRLLDDATDTEESTDYFWSDAEDDAELA